MNVFQLIRSLGWTGAHQGASADSASSASGKHAGKTLPAALLAAGTPTPDVSASRGISASQDSSQASSSSQASPSTTLIEFGKPAGPDPLSPAGLPHHPLVEPKAAVGRSGMVWLIGAGPGSPDLLTLRAHRVLQDADVVVHDQLVPAEVIAMARPQAERISVGKAKGRHSVTQGEIDALLVALARQGKRVARLKAGDPLVFGRAGEEMKALRNAGIPFEIVPGITAALAAAADARVPLTLRGVASSLTFATAHGADGSEPAGWAELARTGGTVAIYMGKSAGREIRDRLANAGLPVTTAVVAVENAGRAHRRIFAGQLGDLPAFSMRIDVAGPVLILAGPAVAEGDVASAEDILPMLAVAA